MKKPTPKQYRKRQIELALDYTSFITCQKCFWPTYDCYICQNCSDSDPDEPASLEDE